MVFYMLAWWTKPRAFFSFQSSLDFNHLSVELSLVNTIIQHQIISILLKYQYPSFFSSS